MDDLGHWIHFDAIQALFHHTTAVITAIFVFYVLGRLIAYLMPDSYAKRVVVFTDDVVLLAVFAMVGWRLLVYLWSKPNMKGPAAPQAQITQPSPSSASDAAEELIASCRKLSRTGDQLDRCVERKEVEAKQALAQAAAGMMVEMRDREKAGRAKIGAARSFDEAQSAFLAFREAECRWRSGKTIGTASANKYWACMARLANERAAQFEEILRR